MKKEIIRIIKGIAGKYSEYEVFTDWIRCMALTISNQCQDARDKLFGFDHDKNWVQREQMYMDIVNKYSSKEMRSFAEMAALLAVTLENNPSDVLGEVYMEAGMGSKAAGQFFTPFHLSLATAMLTVQPDEEGKVYINEPSCGGGGMIIAAAVALKQKGINYQHAMRVVAQELDWKGVYMCYVQMSLLGINGICVQGNTLLESYQPGYPEERVLRTPANWGILV